MSGITLNIDSNPMELMEELKEQQHYKHMWKKNCLEREEEIKKLKEENEELKEQAKKYNELYVKSREMCVENRKIKEIAGIGDGRQTYQQYYEQHTQEIRHLKNTIINNEEQHKLNMLEAKFSTWREVMCKYDSQYTLDDEVSFLNENSNNQEHIKHVFDKVMYGTEYEYDIETKDYKVSEESDEEDDEQYKINMLEEKYHVWREVMCQRDWKYTLDDHPCGVISFLNENSNNNQEHIKKVFDKVMYGTGYHYDIETKDYKVSEESDDDE